MTHGYSDSKVCAGLLGNAVADKVLTLFCALFLCFKLTLGYIAMMVVIMMMVRRKRKPTRESRSNEGVCHISTFRAFRACGVRGDAVLLSVLAMEEDVEEPR